MDDLCEYVIYPGLIILAIVAVGEWARWVHRRSRKPHGKVIAAMEYVRKVIAHEV